MSHDETTAPNAATTRSSGAPVVVDVDSFLIADQEEAGQDAAEPAADPATGPAGGSGRDRPRRAARRRARASLAAPKGNQDDDQDDEGQDLQPCYDTMAAWFKGWFHPLVERQVSTGLVWCPQWWRHNEAVAVLDALWASWEAARASEDGDAMLLWWERAIGLLHHLTSPDHGPFAACSSRQHQVDDGQLALPYEPEPVGYFGWILDTGPDGYGTSRPPETPSRP